MKKSRLTQFRIERKLSRYRVAKDTGIPYNKLARLEDPDLPTINRADLLKLIAYYGPELTLEHLLP